MENKKNNQKKPLKLSVSGRLQIRKNLGPSGTNKNQGNKKTIQIVFKNKKNQQKSSSTAQSNFRGSSSFRTSSFRTSNLSNFSPKNDFSNKSKKNFQSNNKATIASKKNQQKRPTLKPTSKESRKLNLTKIIDQENQEFDKFPSLAKLKRASEKERIKTEKIVEEEKIIKNIIIPEIITVQELANRMAEKTAIVVKTLMKMGVMANVAQSLEADTAALVAAELGYNVKLVNEGDILKEIEDEKDNENDLIKRAPVVTIMGHVDHGKTTILDAFRNSNVVSKEAGRITQHIGAYQIKKNDKKITFIDTPGHEAFSNMRARGSKTTDIIILVVAADDGLKPQTIESISHAKAAKVPIILAINKIDLPAADPDKIRNELLNYEIIVEKLSGDVLDVEISALEKTNLEKLENAIHLQADLLNLSANPKRSARGVVIESKLEKGRGSVATVLVQKGTLKVGNIFVSGSEWGKVKALINDRGEKLKEASPSQPVEVLGFDANPLAGDDFIVVDYENGAKKIAEYRSKKKLQKKNTVIKTNVEEMFKQISKGEETFVDVIIKADVQGSAEAIESSILKLSTEEIKTRVVFKGVGAITESDVALANSSKGFIIGFNVRAIPQAREIAKRDGVDIKYYSIIYELIDDIKNLMSGSLKPDLKENITGNIEIREIFSISKIGKIAGCFVKEGNISRNSKIRLLRDNVVIHTGTINSLKRFKEEVKEVKHGYECGVMIENYSDIKINDIIETFEVIETARTL